MLGGYVEEKEIEIVRWGIRIFRVFVLGIRILKMIRILFLFFRGL